MGVDIGGSVDQKSYTLLFKFSVTDKPKGAITSSFRISPGWAGLCIPMVSPPQW